MVWVGGLDIWDSFVKGTVTGSGLSRASLHDFDIFAYQKIF